jgi:hypothetical protein
MKTLKESRMTVRLTKDDEAAVSALREHLRKSDPWIGRSGVLRFALGYAYGELQRSRPGAAVAGAPH